MFLYFAFITFPIQVIFAKVLMWMCHTELDCLEGYSCHEKVCKKCLRCDMLFRRGNSCVVDFKDCGDCLTGYEEILITDYSTAIKPCKLLKKVKSKKCTSDSSCPQNNYCSEESCVKCFDCSLVNRLPPKENCARSLNECGSCLNGFYEVAVTTYSNSKPCENSVFVIPEMPDSYKMSFSNIAPICFLIIVFFGAVLAILFKRFKGNVLSKTNLLNKTDRPPVFPSAPPLYTVDSSQNIGKLEETESSVITIVKAEKQQAKVFKQPDALYYYVGEGASEFNNLSLTNNVGTISSSWIAATTSDQMVEMDCTAGVLVHRYLRQNIGDALIDSSSQQLNEIDIRQSTSLTTDSITLDILDAAEVVDTTSDDSAAAAVQTENPGPNKT